MRGNLQSIHRLVWLGLLAALIAAGSAVAIPAGPVPITLQTLFVPLAGLILGVRGGVLVVLLYWAAGCLGLPVFAGGKAGIWVFWGPTGGFLLGFLPAAALCGLAARLTFNSRRKAMSVEVGEGLCSISEKSPQPITDCFPLLLLVCALSASVTLAAGTLWLMYTLKISLLKALAVGVTPFLPGGALKCVASAAVYSFLKARGLLPEHPAKKA